MAIAYAEMIRDYEDRKRDRFHESPFYFGADLKFHDAFFLGLRRSESAEVRKLGEFVDRAKVSIEAMQGAIKTLALGVDYRKYARFKRLTPQLQRVMSGDLVVQRPASGRAAPPSADDARFCLDFVIESALALAEFDYSMSEEG